MVKKILIIQVLLIIYSCSNTKGHYKDSAEVKNDSVKVFSPPYNGSTIVSYSDSLDNNQKELYRKVAFQILRNDNLKLPNIKCLTIGDFVQIKGFGKAQLIKFEIVSTNENKIPEVGKLNFFLFIDTMNKKAFVIYLDKINLIRIHKEDSEFLIGGIYKYKNKGYFYIYNILNNQPQLIFQSKELVYNNSNDCQSYRNELLIISNNDIDGDGLLDINFSGIKNIYCEGMEEGYGKFDRKPISFMKISYDYYLINSQNPIWEKK